MNTIKFIDNTFFSTETHDPENERIETIDLFGKKIKIVNPINLNILITYSCNCKCEFCIVNQENKLEMISNELYIERLDKYLKELKDLPIEITITGGEPTLSPERLLKVFDLLKKYNFPYRTFSTNGAGLLNELNQKSLLQYLKEYKVNKNINISRMLLEQNVNDAIFQNRTISKEELSCIAEYCYINDLDMRLSTNFMKSGIKTYEDMIQYVKEAKDIGIKNIVFRELVGNIKEFISNKEIIKKIEATAELIETIENDFYIIKSFKLNNDAILNDYIIKIYISKKQKEKILSSLVYREGKLSNGWQTKEFFEV